MSKPTTAPSIRLQKVLFGAMSVLSFGGPFGVMWILRGGTEEAWPPDRPVEWVALIGMCLAVAALMVALLAMNLRLTKAMKDARKPPGGEP